MIKFDRDEVAKIWAGLYHDYNVLTNNNKALQYYSLAKRLMYIETRKYVGKIIHSQMSMRKMKPKTLVAYVERLKSFEFNYIGTTQNEESLKDLDRQIRACDNEIGLKRDELEKLKEKGAAAMTLEQQTVKVEQALGRNLVDPRKTSVTKWHYMMKEIQALSEARQKQEINRKRKR